MAELNQIYKCEVCGNIVEVVHTGAGELVCCKQPMILKVINTEDAVQEKHIPVIEKIDKGFKITIGKILHPMEKSHYIEWIEIIADGRVYRKYLKPDTKLVAEFCIKAENITVRGYCNLHGLWKS